MFPSANSLILSVERNTGIEPASQAWETSEALRKPLHKGVSTNITDCYTICYTISESGMVSGIVIYVIEILLLLSAALVLDLLFASLSVMVTTRRGTFLRLEATDAGTEDSKHDKSGDADGFHIIHEFCPPHLVIL